MTMDLGMSEKVAPLVEKIRDFTQKRDTDLQQLNMLMLPKSLAGCTWPQKR